MSKASQNKINLDPAIYAYLCSEIRKDPDYSMAGDNYGYLSPNGYNMQVLKIYEDEKSGYFGVAFKIGGNVIVAHRGTDDPFSLILKDKGIKEVISEFLGDSSSNLDLLTGHKPVQLSSAINFIKELKKEFPSEVSDNKLIMTGYSLGGALAQLAALKFDSSSIVFDNPGIKEIAKNLDLSLDRDQEFVSICTKPNIINSINSQITKIYQVKLDEKAYEPNESGFIKYSLDLHNIDSIKKALIGKSLEEIKENLDNWSDLKKAYKNYLSYDSNKAMWDSFIINQYKQDKNKKEYDSLPKPSNILPYKPNWIKKHLLDNFSKKKDEDSEKVVTENGKNNFLPYKLKWIKNNLNKESSKTIDNITDYLDTIKVLPDFLYKVIKNGGVKLIAKFINIVQTEFQDLSDYIVGLSGESDLDAEL